MADALIVMSWITQHNYKKGILKSLAIFSWLSCRYQPSICHKNLTLDVDYNIIVDFSGLTFVSHQKC